MMKLTIFFAVAVLVFYAKAVPVANELRYPNNNMFANFGDNFPQMPQFNFPPIRMPTMPVMPEMPKPPNVNDIMNMKPANGGVVSGVSQSSSVTYETVDGKLVPVVKRKTVINDNGNITVYEN